MRRFLSLAALALSASLGAAQLRGKDAAKDQQRNLAAAKGQTILQQAEFSHQDVFQASYDLPQVFGGDPAGSDLENWAATNFASGMIKHHPTTYEEAAAIIKWVKEKGQKIRPMGTVHSWTKLMPDNNQHVIFMDKFRGISQSSKDCTIVTIQAGVLQAELADWADNENRSPCRFTYLPGNTLVQGMTFVGGISTSSHGSGFVPPIPDYVIAMTIIDSWGNIKKLDLSNPDFKVYAACLGMCGVIMDVTVKFNPDASAKKVVQAKTQYTDMFPLDLTKINKTYNPLKHFLETSNGGAINYSPYNSAIVQNGWLDPKMIDVYHQADGLWTHAHYDLPGTPVSTKREGPKTWGTQHEPYFDKDLVVGADWLMNVPGTRFHRMAGGDWRPNQQWANYSAFMQGMMANQILFLNPPSFGWRTSTTYNTSAANACHFLRYMEKITDGLDFEFAFKIDDDYMNIYKAWWAMIELNDEMWRERNEIPLNIFGAIRWTSHSDCPVSHCYGKPGDKFVVMEAASAHGTAGWEEYTKRLFHRWSKITSKDGSRPRPHWAKFDLSWVPEMKPYIKDVSKNEIARMRPVILKEDPTGLFRTKWLSEIFDVPF